MARQGTPECVQLPGPWAAARLCSGRNDLAVIQAAIMVNVLGFASADLVADLLYELPSPLRPAR